MICFRYFGTEDKDEYTPLSTEQQLKLQQLTVVSMAGLSKVRTYTPLASHVWIHTLQVC